MPTTYNGVGTHYHGKKNIYTRYGDCKSCGRAGELVSYDTKLYFVILFAPVIPLGAKRILDQCPHCHRHYVLKLDEWETNKREGQTKALTEYKEAPQDPKKAIAALGATLGFHDVDAFRQLSPTIHKNLADDPEVVETLAGLHDMLGEPDLAVKLFREALALKDDPDTRISLIGALLHTQNPDAAEEELALLPEGEETRTQRADLRVLQAQSYQSLGRHEKALASFAAALELHPSFNNDKAFRKLVKQSEKYRGSSKTILSDAIRTKKVSASSGKESRAAFVTGIFFILLIVAAVVGYFYAANYYGHHQEVHVVSGLRFPYQITVNGVRSMAHPFRPFTIEVEQGEVVVEGSGTSPSTGEPFTIGPRTVTIRTPYWSRPFANPALILNPDETATFERQEATYGQGMFGSGSAAAPETILPAFYHHITGINHVFEEFPDSVTSQAGMSETRTRLAVIGGGDVNDEELIRGILMDGHIDEAVELARHRLACDPEEGVALRFLRALRSPEEFIEEARPHLEHRPVRVEWHRLYQEARKRQDPESDVAAEYRALLEKEPGNGDLMYLLGRELGDAEAAVALFERAAAAEPPSANGIYAVGFRAFCEARFDDAYLALGKAYESNKSNERFQKLFIDACIAGRHYEEASKLLSALDAVNHPNADMMKEVMIAVVEGKTNQARSIVSKKLQQYKDQLSSQQMAQAREVFETYIAYMQGDIAKFASSVTADSGPNPLFQKALSVGDLDEAAAQLAALDEEGEADWADSLWLYTANAGTGRAEPAAAPLAEAIKLLRADSDSNLSKAADLLEAEAAPTYAQLLGLPIHPDKKCSIAVALAVRAEGDERLAMLKLGRALNYDVQFPHYFLERMIEEMGGGKADPPPARVEASEETPAEDSAEPAASEAAPAERATAPNRRRPRR